MNESLSSHTLGPGATLLPWPSSLVRRGGHVVMPAHGTITLPAAGGDTGGGDDESPMRFWAEQLRQDLRAAGADGWDIRTGAPSAEPDGATGTTQAGEHEGGILLELGTGPENGAHITDSPAGSYTLQTRGHAPQCTVSAADPQGLRNGIQTLRQLLRTAGPTPASAPTLPELTITDSPALAVRGYSLDVSRGRVPTRRTLTRLIDTLQLCKYTQLQLYVESAVAFPQTRQAWQDSTPLTFDDIRWLDGQCRLRGLDLVPELACFGHMYDILRTPLWRHLGEHPEQADRPFSFVERMQHHTLNPADPRSLDFVTGMIDDYAPLFSSHLFNIGGDETFDLGTGASAPLARRIGVPRLYAGFIGKICAHLDEHGLTPVMYADIALRHPELLGLLPADAILAEWDYAADPDTGNVEKVAESGHRQLVCPGVQTWNRLLPDVQAAWTNISRMCRAGQKNAALGMLVTDWGDFGHINDPLMSLPGLAFAAECSWSASPRPRAEVEKAASRLLFGDPDGVIVDCLARAARLQLFGWDDAVRWAELEEGPGRANPDVLRALGQPAWQQDDLAAARRTFLDARPLPAGTVRAADEQLDGVLDAVRALPGMPGGTGATGLDRDVIPTVEVMVRGQKILNHLGLALHGREDDPDGLASALQKWAGDYARRWDAVSRPSRLDDVLAVLRAFSHTLTRRTGSGTNITGNTGNGRQS